MFALDMAHFYQLSNSEKVRKQLAQKINIDLEHFRNPNTRGQELLHSQLCAYWTEFFKRLNPDATVVRDHHFWQFPRVWKDLVEDPREPEVLPDILLMFPKQEMGQEVTIAVEVERSKKSHPRLLRKLWKMACATRLDGVIYICDGDSISNLLIQLYESKIRERAPRIKYYGANFFTFTNTVLASQADTQMLITSESKLIRLNDWMQFLLTNPRSGRMKAQSTL